MSQTANTCLSSKESIHKYTLSSRRSCVYLSRQSLHVTCELQRLAIAMTATPAHALPENKRLALVRRLPNHATLSATLEPSSAHTSCPVQPSRPAREQAFGACPQAAQPCHAVCHFGAIQCTHQRSQLDQVQVPDVLQHCLREVWPCGVEKRGSRCCVLGRVCK